MKSDRDSERYISDYGNLLLVVSRRSVVQERVFGYTATDKRDGFICWSGSALRDLLAAQSDRDIRSADIP